MRIQTILFPTDFSEAAEKALDVARSLARDHQTKLVLVHTVRVRKAVASPLPQHGNQSFGIEGDQQIAEAVELGWPTGEPQSMTEVNG